MNCLSSKDWPEQLHPLLLFFRTPGPSATKVEMLVRLKTEHVFLSQGWRSPCVQSVNWWSNYFHMFVVLLLDYYLSLHRAARITIPHTTMCVSTKRCVGVGSVLSYPDPLPASLCKYPPLRYFQQVEKFHPTCTSTNSCKWKYMCKLRPPSSPQLIF